MEKLNVESLTTVQTGKASKSNLPRKEADLVSVAQRVHAKMAETGICPLWTSAETFEAKISEIDAGVQKMSELKSRLKQVSNELRILNAEIDIGLLDLKDGLTGKFGRDRAKAYATEFGMESRGGRTTLPINREKRIRSLEAIVAAIDKYGISLLKSSKEFWAEHLARLQSLSDESKSLKSAMAAEVRQKQLNIKYLRRVLRTTLLVLKGNYPDDYKRVIRNWGILKENF